MGVIYCSGRHIPSELSIFQKLMINPGIFPPLILQSGANAIYYAARHGHVETLKFLHEKKCPLDVQDKVKFYSHVLSAHTHPCSELARS